MLLAISAITAFSQKEKINTKDFNSLSSQVLYQIENIPLLVAPSYFLFGKSLEGIITYSILPAEQASVFIFQKLIREQNGCNYSAACRIAPCRAMKTQLSRCSHSPSRGERAGHHEKCPILDHSRKKNSGVLGFSTLQHLVQTLEKPGALAPWLELSSALQPPLHSRSCLPIP